MLGLQWHAQHDSGARDKGPTDLDAICELRDGQGRLLELVGPGRLRNFNGSVMHTGDSRTGASRWDGERIFVFIDALPEAVDTLVFTIASSGGVAFRDIAGASCHVSDNGTDEKLLTVQLTDLGAVTEHPVATLQRTPRGWVLNPGQVAR